MKLLALDIGGTAVKYGFFGSSTEFGSFLVKDFGGEENLPQKIIECISRYDADCIGISAPGPFDFGSGTGLMEHKLKSLYKVSLKEMINQKFPGKDLFFIHDSTAFIFGAIAKHPHLAKGNIAGIMLGTGLGYVHCIGAKSEVNQNKTPFNPMWNKPYKNKIAENYVSATAILQRAREKGFLCDNVKEIATKARSGKEELLQIFFETGKDLGELCKAKQREDGFESIVIGGQVSGAWDLMKPRFESVCSIDCMVVNEPAKCPLFGIKYCAEKEENEIYLIK